jgi:hypothetical protein
VLLLRVLLGLEPNRELGVLEARACDLPEWCEGLVLTNVRALGRSWTVRVEDGAASVHETDGARI